jgi:hypothetical protein
VWALEMFKKVLGREVQPSVIVIDRELALMNAIKVIFSNIPNLLCVWHIEKNVLSKCKKYFGEQETWEEFLSSWNEVVYSSSEGEYERSWLKFKSTNTEKKDVIKYIKNVWLP